MFEIQNVLMQQPARMLLHQEDLLILVQVVHVVALVIIVTFIRIVLQTLEHIQEVLVGLLLLILAEQGDCAQFFRFFDRDVAVFL